jgi:ATP-dependent Lon protease
MTGEISLRGLVLPVGGIKEKVIAAARAGLTTVILLERNRKDYEDIPEAARAALRFIWAERVEQVIDAALKQPKPRLRHSNQRPRKTAQDGPRRSLS